MPLDSDRHLIVKRGSDMVLNAVGNGRDSYTQFEQRPVQPDMAASAQTWHMRLKNNHISEAYLVSASSTCCSPRISGSLRLLRGQDARAGAQLAGGRLLQPGVGTVPLRRLRRSCPHLPRQAGDADSIPDVPRLTGYRAPSSDRTPETLVGSVLMLFPLVNDPALSRARQAQENPYYVLKRHGYWPNVYYYEHSGCIRVHQVRNSHRGPGDAELQAGGRDTGV